MKKVLDLILTAYIYLVIGFTSGLLIAIAIFGGEVSIVIHWDSWKLLFKQP